MDTAWKRVLVAVAVTGVVGLTACSGGDAGGGGAEPSVGAPERIRADDGSGGAGGGNDVAFQTAAPSELPSIGPSIIKTGRIEIEVERGSFDESVQEVVALAQQLNGFVLSTSISSEEKDFGTIVIRVPSDDFETAVGDLKSIGELANQEISGKDVTEEFVDLQARLRNFEAQEAVLLRLMDRATTIGQTIRVQGELSNVQLEIEGLRGRLRFLRDRTEMSTINVSLHEVGAAPAPASTLGRAWERAGKAFLDVVSGMIVALGFFVPVGLIALVGFLLLRPVAARLSSRPRPETP